MMSSPYKRIKEEIIQPWLLTNAEKDSMVKQIAKLREVWTDFQAYILGQGRLSHLKLYRPYQWVDKQWIIEFYNFEPNLDDLERFLRLNLKAFKPIEIDAIVHHKKSQWITCLICHFSQPFYIPENYLEYVYKGQCYRPKFKLIYKIDKYMNTITSERPHSQRKILFCKQFDGDNGPQKKQKDQQKLNELKEGKDMIDSKIKLEDENIVFNTPTKDNSIQLVASQDGPAINLNAQVMPKEFNEESAKNSQKLATLQQEFSQIKELLYQMVKRQEQKQEKKQGKGKSKKTQEAKDANLSQESGIKEENQNKP